MKTYIMWTDKNALVFDHVVGIPYSTLLRVYQKDRLVHFVAPDDMGFSLKNGSFICELGRTNEFLALLEEVPPYDPNILDREYPPTRETWENVLADRDSMQLWETQALENMEKMENTNDDLLKYSTDLLKMYVARDANYTAVMKVLGTIIHHQMGGKCTLVISDIRNFNFEAREENGILYLKVEEGEV